MAEQEDAKPPAPIAIVGMSCRLPRDIKTPDDIWIMCSRGRSAWSEIPGNRFSKDAYYHPNPGKKGTHNAKGGNFLEEDITLFDAPFFGVTVTEARAIDPNQRVMLEVVFEALENAGIPKSDVVGRNVGVFMGAYGADYEVMNARDIETTSMFNASGCSTALISGRVSYYFGMRGPSLTINTACSSSLVALHYACQSIRNSETYCSGGRRPSQHKSRYVCHHVYSKVLKSTNAEYITQSLIVSDILV
jgi:acyl transferase domain-containing protein